MNHSSFHPPSPVSALPLNRTAQFCFGLVILLITIKLWWSGWFSMRLMHASGMGSSVTDDVGSPLALVPFLLDSVCLVGALGFTSVYFLRAAVVALFRYGFKKVVSLRDESDDAGRGTSETSSRILDPEKVKQVFQDLRDRLVALEVLHPEVVPPTPQDPPTMQQLMEELQTLKRQLVHKSADAADSSDTVTVPGDDGRGAS